MDYMLFQYFETKRLNQKKFRDFIAYCGTNKARVKRIKNRRRR